MVKTAAILDKEAKLWLRTSKFDHTHIPSNGYRLLGLGSFELRRRKIDLITVYNILHGQTRLDISFFFTVCDTITRGYRSKIRPPHSGGSIRVHFFVHRTGCDYLESSKRHIISLRYVTFIFTLRYFITLRYSVVLKVLPHVLTYMS